MNDHTQSIYSSDNNTIFPVVVLGGGPVGLFAVFMAGMMQLKCALIEALPQLGGQCQALYPDKPIYDIPGMPEISAGDLVAQLSQQMAPFKPTVFCGQTAEHVDQEEESGLFVIRTSAGRVILAQTIMICCGAGALVPKRPPLEGIEQFEGQSVFYSVPSGHGWAGKDIVIAGGGDSAVDWALVLAGSAKSVHMVHRRARFSAHEHSVARLQEEFQSGRVQLHAPYQLLGLEGQVGQISVVHVHDGAGGSKSLSADILLPFFGMQNDLGPLGRWGLDIDQQRIVTNPLTGQTSRAGIYAAGDIVTYPHKLKLIMTGFAEVAQSMHHLKGYLFPNQYVGVKHSTTLGNPGSWAS